MVLSLAAKTANDTSKLVFVNKRWGTTGNDEYLIRGADMDVISGKTPEPSAAQLTWRSPHEAVADLSGQTEPMLLRMHYHPGWSAGERATLTSGSAGWMQVTT